MTALSRRSSAGTTDRWLNRPRGRGFRLCLLIAPLLTPAPHAWGQNAVAAAASPTPPALPVSAAGEWLAHAVDKLDVEHHWLRGTEHVAWRSGVRLLEEHGKKLTPLAKDETHCSAFAAAAADSLGVYLLHPPEHSHVLLANAQHDWLPSDAGKNAGWRAVEGPVDAQRLANGGELVVAVFKNTDPTLAGHIAIIRPAAVAVGAVLAQGPMITQAGFNNYRAAPLAAGFDHHPGAWAPGGSGGVRFYAHAVTAQALAGE